MAEDVGHLIFLKKIALIGCFQLEKYVMHFVVISQVNGGKKRPICHIVFLKGVK